MLNDGVYKYYTLNDDSGERVYKGAIKISKGQLSILKDDHGIMDGMFKEGPVSQRVEDTMRSVNRNGYAIFIKAKSSPDLDKDKKESDSAIHPDAKSVYETIGKSEVSGKHYKRLDSLMQKKPNQDTNKTEEVDMDIEKGELANKMKVGLSGMAIAGALAAPMATPMAAPQQDAPGQVAQVTRIAEAKPQAPTNPKKDRILNSIADVESNNGANVAHEATPKAGPHHGEKAYGMYGLMPMVIRETIKGNPDLLKDHGGAVKMIGPALHDYMAKHPELEHEIASRHYDKLSKHFGDSPEKIGYGWLNGVVGTNRAIKQGVNFKKHWHVQKILKAHEARKKANK